MEYKCDLIADEIWERARAGEDLPPDVREPQPAPATEKRTVARDRPEVNRPRRLHTAPKQAPVQVVKEPPKHEAVTEQASVESAEVVSYDDQPVAAVAVTWPSADGEIHGAEWRGYTNIDTTTGEITTCRVQRSADGIYINLESKASGQRPGEGA